MNLRIVLMSLFCAAMADKHRLCACTVAGGDGEIDDAVTQTIAANSKGKLTYSYHGWCREEGAPRNGYYLFATAVWYQDTYVGGNEMHDLCVKQYTAGASVCFDPKKGRYDDTSVRDLNYSPCGQ